VLRSVAFAGTADSEAAMDSTNVASGVPTVVYVPRGLRLPAHQQGPCGRGRRRPRGEI